MQSLFAAKFDAMHELLQNYDAMKHLLLSSINHNECSSIVEVSFNTCLNELKTKDMPDTTTQSVNSEQRIPLGTIGEIKKEVTSKISSIELQKMQSIYDKKTNELLNQINSVKII